MLVSDPSFADAFAVFDIHNVVGQCEGAPCGKLTNTQGYQTNAVDIGLSKIKAMAELAGNASRRVCIVLSAQESRAVRKAVYPNYKGTRIHSDPVCQPVTLWDGMRHDEYRYDGVRDLMDIMRFIPSLTLGMPKNDGETDDAIGTFVHDVSPKPCFVCTNDRDMWSLMSDNVKLFKKPMIEFTQNDLVIEFGISNPWKIALAKALFGDKSDNIKPIVSGTPKDPVQPALEACRMIRGERQYAPALFRELEQYRGSKKIDKLFMARDQIAFAERWIRLRRIELSYRFGQRNPDEFKKRLDWYGIMKKAPKLLEFAAS
jgi:hypothetical protein